MKIFFLLLLFTHQVTAAERLFERYDPKKKQTVIETFENKTGTTVSKRCVSQSGSGCQALKALSVKPKVSKRNTPLLGHPASMHCDAVGGTNLILLDVQKREFDFCFFKDGSAISSWDLFNAQN